MYRFERGPGGLICDQHDHQGDDETRQDGTSSGSARPAIYLWSAPPGKSVPLPDDLATRPTSTHQQIEKSLQSSKMYISKLAALFAASLAVSSAAFRAAAEVSTVHSTTWALAHRLRSHRAWASPSKSAAPVQQIQKPVLSLPPTSTSSWLPWKGLRLF